MIQQTITGRLLVDFINIKKFQIQTLSLLFAVSFVSIISLLKLFSQSNLVFPLNDTFWPFNRYIIIRLS